MKMSAALIYNIKSTEINKNAQMENLLLILLQISPQMKRALICH